MIWLDWMSSYEINTQIPMKPWEFVGYLFIFTNAIWGIEFLELGYIAMSKSLDLLSDVVDFYFLLEVYT